MATRTGPRDVLTTVCSARAALTAATLSPESCTGTLAGWVEVLGELQAVIDVATALQDSAIVALAAVETEAGEEGTLVESRRAPGHVALDAPAIVSGVLNVSATHAEQRVRDAVRRAADGSAGTDTCTGLGGLHAAMVAGRLDAYRSGVLAHELEEVPADVAATVVDTLDAWFDREDGPALRRRVRRVLARISPDLLRQRAARARSGSSLQRWVGEPGVDTWHGTFPSEEACTAWAAIDSLAQQYVADGTCERIDRARARALTNLVTQQATIDVRVTLTTAADTAAAVFEDQPPSLPSGVATDLVEAAGARAGKPLLVERGWLERAVARTRVDGRDRVGRPRVVVCHVATGAPVDPADELSSTGYRPTAGLAAFVRARDGHCRFPGCHVAARFCDLDHVVSWPAGPTSAANLACLCRRHHRIKQRPGWRVVLHPDATMSWTDPTGRTRVTHPPDALHPVVLPDTGTDPPLPTPGRPSLVLPEGPHSALEHHLEHEAAKPAPCRVHIARPALTVTCVPRAHRPRLRSRATDPPPF